jgi:hypothetical protein
MKALAELDNSFSKDTLETMEKMSPTSLKGDTGGIEERWKHGIDRGGFANEISHVTGLYERREGLLSRNSIHTGRQGW